MLISMSIHVAVWFLFGSLGGGRAAKDTSSQAGEGFEPCLTLMAVDKEGGQRGSEGGQRGSEGKPRGK